MPFRSITSNLEANLTGRVTPGGALRGAKSGYGAALLDHVGIGPSKSASKKAMITAGLKLLVRLESSQVHRPDMQNI